MANKYNSIKLGGEYKTYTIRRWTYTNVFSFANEYASAPSEPDYAGMTDDQIKTKIVYDQGASIYGYDYLGNETDEDGWLAPHKPVFANAYITDRVEYEDLILNLGLRYDYIDVDNLMMVDPANPQLSVNANTGALIQSGWTEVPSFSAVSPRIGLSFPITDRTMFHAQFGKFVQQTRLNDMYQGYSRVAYELRQSYAFLAAVGSNIRPTRTTQYELGFTQQVTDFLSFDITGYYKDVKDDAIFTEITVSKDASILGNYNTLVNGDYATTKGVEVALTMRRYERIALNASIALQDARGTGSSPYTNTGIVGAPLDKDLIYTPKFIEPLDYNFPLKANLNIDYRFGSNDGPSILHDFGASLLVRYNSGHPYTRGEGVQDLEGDARGRYPIESLNASTSPSFFQVDFKIDKSFTIFDKLAATVYLRVINLFDTKNEINVFARTGSADDDGVLSDPRYGQAKLNEYGSRYNDIYKAITLGYQTTYNTATTNLLYGEARQVHLGIRIEY
jgi:outer membrane receptor for Fe3+-dicitrate